MESRIDRKEFREIAETMVRLACSAQREYSDGTLSKNVFDHDFEFAVNTIMNNAERVNWAGTVSPTKYDKEGDRILFLTDQAQEANCDLMLSFHNRQEFIFHNSVEALEFREEMEEITGLPLPLITDGNMWIVSYYFERANAFDRCRNLKASVKYVDFGGDMLEILRPQE